MDDSTRTIVAVAAAGVAVLALVLAVWSQLRLTRVRYDAFGDMGRRLSFSAAIVDDLGDGIVISSIHTRSESRTYAKGIVGGASSITLTPEEQQALCSATHGEPRRAPQRTDDKPNQKDAS